MLAVIIRFDRRVHKARGGLLPADSTSAVAAVDGASEATRAEGAAQHSGNLREERRIQTIFFGAGLCGEWPTAFLYSVREHHH